MAASASLGPLPDTSENPTRPSSSRTSALNLSPLRPAEAFPISSSVRNAAWSASVKALRLNRPRRAAVASSYVPRSCAASGAVLFGPQGHHRRLGPARKRHHTPEHSDERLQGVLGLPALAPFLFRPADRVEHPMSEVAGTLLLDRTSRLERKHLRQLAAESHRIIHPRLVHSSSGLPPARASPCAVCSLDSPRVAAPCLHLPEDKCPSEPRPIATPYKEASGGLRRHARRDGARGARVLLRADRMRAASLLAGE